VRRTEGLQVAAALIGVGGGVVSARLAFSAAWYAFGDTAAPGAVLGLGAGAALLGAGLVQLGEETEWKAGALLATAGIAWFMTVWDDPYAPAWIFVAGRIFGTVWPVLVTHGLLRMFGPLTRSERTPVVAAYACTVGAALAATLLFDPATNSCIACPANPLLLVDDPQAATRVGHAATLAGPVWSVLLAAALTHRLVRATAARRRLMFPIAASGTAVLGTVAAGYIHAVAGGLPEAAGTLLWTTSVLLVLLSLSTGWPTLSLALTRQRLARFVVQVSAVPPIGGLGGALGAVLHDPTARLLYPLDGSAADDLIDVEGEPSQPRATLTPLTRGTTTVAYLDHHADLLEPDAAAIARVARLSLDNERLHAERAAQLRELRASRVRIVAAADRQRRRLERDLHDGAQQRLVSLALGIRLEGMTPLSTSGSDGAALLDDAEAEVAAALAELRTIARGLFPRELADEGLEAALETFAETDPTPIELDLQLPDHAPSAVESAAFFAVAHLLATSSYTPTPGREVQVRHLDGHLELDLRGSTDIDDLTAVEDRVGAVGGTIDRVGAGAIRIELPCGS
jgi:signal transduction histidine kinase